MKQLELLNDFTGVIIIVCDGCLALVDMDRTGNTLHNKDNSISIDMEKLTLKGRTAKGVFKSLMNQVISIIWDEYPESNETEQLVWAADEEYKIWVCYNKEPRHPYNYKDSL
jgi:hypothetical protein